MDYKPLILTFLLATQSFAQSAFDPLTIGIGARALGMGSAYVAMAEDGDTIFSNPAGLGEIDAMKFTSMSGNLLEDLYYSQLGGIFPLGNKTAVGIGYAGAFVSSIDIRDTSGTLSRKANYGSSVALLSYGKKLTEKFSLGINLKYHVTDGTEVDSGDERGWNADIGVIQNGHDWLSFGLAAHNLLNTYPQSIRIGAKARLLDGNLNLTLETRYRLQAAKVVTFHGGIEYSPIAFLTLRAGSDQENLTAGISLKTAGLGFHYAYHPYGGFEGNVGHYFSISFDELGWPPDVPPEIHLGGGCKDSLCVLK